MKNKLADVLNVINVDRILVVSKSSFSRFGLDKILAVTGVEVSLFDGYNPNPDYEDIVNGVELFRERECQAILAVGGGSTIDVAKCIKAYANMEPGKDYMEQEINPGDIPFVAIPTTAGSGSEVTPNAVIYRNKVKQSVADARLKPNYVILEGSVLETLPVYQKKCTAMDALCQAIEAWWSLKANDESIWYSRRAIELLVPNIIEYVYGESDNNVNQKIMEGSNLAGKAIAIAGTTAPHAMSYRLTGLYGIAHGHGVALTLPKVWQHMLENIEECTDPRGMEYVRNNFAGIAMAVLEIEVEETNDNIIQRAIELLEDLLTVLELEKPISDKKEEELENLVSSVPESKCKTNPVKTTSEDIKAMYKMVLM